MGWALRRAWRGLLLLLGLPLLLLGAVLSRVGRPELLVLRIKGALPETAPRGLRRWLAGRGERRLTLTQVLAALEELERVARPRGVLLVLDRAELSLVAAEELRAALERVRAAGKRVVAWVDPTSGPALLAAAPAERLLALPESDLEWLGLRVRGVFLRDLLQQAGIGVQVERRGRYKTAADLLVEQGLSEANREMLSDLGRDLQEQMVAPLARARGLEPQALVALLGEAPVSHRRAEEARLLDGRAWRDELEARAGQLLGAGDEPRTCGPERLLAARARRRSLGGVLVDRPRVAVLRLAGTIHGGEEGQGIPGAAGVEALEALREARRVRAVVLRIDSPGGSAFASDELWRAATRLAEKKPVVASLGRVAASGGYYLAVGATRIVAHPATLTGSIGVISARFHLAPLLRRLGVSVDALDFAPRAGLLDPDRPLSDEEREALGRDVERIYRVFLERVAAGRKRPVSEIEPVAAGRVWTGRRARELGLVDALGGQREAVREACALAGIRGEPELWRCELPERGLRALVGGRLALPAPLDSLAQAWTLAREPVLAWCPWQVEC